jgi:hypothetical protein
MAIQGRGSISAPPRRRQSLKARENDAEIEKPKKKRVITGNYLHPDRTVEEDLPDDSADAPDSPPALEDVSEQEFTVSWAIVLGSIQLDADSDDVKLGQFSYRDLNVKAIKEVSRATSKGKKDFEWVSTSGVLGGRGVIKAHERPFKVNDEEGWKKVENAVEKSMRNGKRDILFKLTFNYKKVTLDDSSDSEDERPHKKKKGRVHIHVFTKLTIDEHDHQAT